MKNNNLKIIKEKIRTTNQIIDNKFEFRFNYKN